MADDSLIQPTQAIPTDQTPPSDEAQNNATAVEGTPDASNKAQEATASSGATNPLANGQQPQDGASQPQQTRSNELGDNLPNKQDTPQSQNLPANDPNNPATHPAVKQAGIIHAIGQALMGGPRYTTTIDANTGKAVYTPVPMSGKEIGMAIALQAITGGIAGLAQKGPGAEGKAAAAGFQAAQEQQQKVQEQQQQQASQDYARAAAITQTNFQTHQNALRLSQADLDFHKQFVGSSEPVLNNIKQVGAALESGVHESDLLTKYHVSKDMAIPDGVVENGKNPDGSIHYENTYTVIDPNKKIELPKETAQLLADLRIPNYFTMDSDGTAKPIDFTGSAQIKAGLVVNGLAMAQGFQITEQQINKQFAGLKGGDKEAVEFDANLKKSISNGDLTVKGLQTIANYSNMPFDKAVAAMEKNKVDPTIIAQYQRLVPQEAQEQAKLKGESDEADRKAADTARNLVVNRTNFDTVLSNPSAYSSQQVQAAQAAKQSVHQEKINDAAGEASARTQAEIDVKKRNGIPLTGSKSGKPSEDDAPLVDPKLAPFLQDDANYNTPNGTNDKFLAELKKTDPGRAAIVDAYSKGMDIQSYYAAVKKFGGSLNAYIHAYDPSFNASQMRSYDKTVSDARPAGPIGKANRAASTAFVHLNNLSKTIGIGSVTGLSGDYKATKGQATSEMSNAYANGNKPGEKEIEENREGLGSKIPSVASGAIKASARNLMEKVQADYNAVDQNLPKAVQRPGFIDPAGANAYKEITGNPVELKLLIKPTGTLGTVTNKVTGKLHFYGQGNKDLGEVPGQ